MVTKTVAVTYSGDACKVDYYDVLLRYKITEHEGVYDWEEYPMLSTTIANLKTAVQSQIDALKLKVEARKDTTLA